MEAEGPAFLLGHAREELSAGLDRSLRIMVHRDGPADVVEHEDMMMDDVADVDERLVPRADFEAGMSVGMPGAAMTVTASWNNFWPSLAMTSWSLRMSKLRQTVFTMFGRGFLSRLDLEKSGFGPRQKSYSSCSR
jgi:hypothetical protein